MKRTVCALMALCIVGTGVLPAMGERPVLAAETVDLENGLAAYLKFDENLTKNSASETNLTAEVQGSGVVLKNTEGVSGGAAYFSGSADSSIRFANALNAATENLTFSAWIKCDIGGSGKRYLFQQSDSGRSILYLNESGKMGTYLTASDVLSSSAVPAQTWTHIAFTSDHATKKVQFYINGEQINENTLSGDFVNAATALILGAHKSLAADSALKGYMDEFRFYKKTLSAEEIQGIYELHSAAVEVPALQELLAEAKNLTGGTDAQEKVLKECIAKTEEKIADLSAVTGKKAKELREKLQETMDTYLASRTIEITADTSKELREISKAMFGINHRYHNDGYSSWNATEKKIEEEFNKYVKEAAFGSIRYPGGTVSNLFDWKRSIGPTEERKKTVHGLPETSDPITPNFGLDEAMSWIYDDLGSEAIWVYGMGQGSAADAADLVEYLNAPADGDATNPNGGVDWAEVRAENGHPEPYGVTRFEIGNEIGYYRQTYWMDGRGSTDLVDTYIDGGRMSYGQNTRTVKEEDWRDSATNSDGTANQIRYVRYTPAVEGTISVYVGGTQWQIVDSLDGQGAANVCTVDHETGKIVFGDGVNGNIPQSGKAITASYQSDRDGFKEYYVKMKQVSEEIGTPIQVYSGIGKHEAFAQKMAQKGYNAYYDGIVIHPYSDTSGGVIADDDPQFYEKVLGRSQQYNMTRVKTLVDEMEKDAPGQKKVPVLSEFGVYNHNTQFVRGIGHAVYIANEMIDYIGYGTPYINKHCLVDYPYGADNLGSGSQCVVQAIKQNDGTIKFVSTPSAKMFSIFNHMTGNEQVEQTIEGNSVYYTYQGYDVPLVKAISSKDEEGNTYITVVNNSKDAETTVKLAVKEQDLSGKEIEVWYLTSKSVYDENTADNPNKVDVQKTTITAGAKTMEYTLTPHSITSFKIPADKKEEQPEQPTPKPTPKPAQPTPTPKPEIKNPEAPKKVKAKKTKKGIQITWKKVSNTDGYYIYRSLKKKKGYKKIKTITKQKTSIFFDKKARKGKKYYYKIVAYKKNGSKKLLGQYSKIVSKKA